jgi:peroxiredoxin
MKILKSMADYHASLDAVTYDAGLVMNRTLQGETENMAVDYRFHMDRPANRFAMAPLDEGEQRGGSIYNDGQSVSMYAPQLDKYTIEDSPESLDDILEGQLIGALSRDIGVIAGGLLHSDPYKALFDTVVAASVVGKGELDGQSYHRLSVDHSEWKWEVWIADGDKPQFLRIVPDLSAFIAQAKAEGQDVSMEMYFHISNFDPKPKLTGDLFAFSPPEGAKEVATFFEAPPAPPAHAALLGKPAPGFTLERLEGGQLDIASHIDKNVVVLDFWATWCGPCVQAMPILAEVTDAMKDKGVVFYAVNLREDKAKINGFLQAQGLNINVLLDTDGAIANLFGVTGIPQTVILGKDGTVQAIHVGLSPNLRQSLMSELEHLVAGKSLAGE